MGQPRRGRSGDVTAAGIFVVMWSSGFIGAAFGTEVTGTVTLLMWRYTVAATVLLVWRFVIAGRRLTARELAVQGLVGVFSQSIYMFCMYKAIELGVTSGIVSLTGALQPVCASAFAGLLLDERISVRQWAGLAVGLLGVGVVISGDLGLRPDVPGWAYALPFAGMAALTVATLLGRRVAAGTSPVDALAVQCGVSAALFGLLGLSTGQATVPTAGQAWLAVAWLALMPTMVGFWLYWVILQRRGVAHVSSLIYLAAPTTMLWGLVMFGDEISLVSGVGLLVCVAGVALVHRGRHGGGAASPAGAGGEASPSAGVPARPHPAGGGEGP